MFGSREPGVTEGYHEIAKLQSSVCSLEERAKAGGFKSHSRRGGNPSLPGGQACCKQCSEMSDPTDAEPFPPSPSMPLPNRGRERDQIKHGRIIY